jgi:hypothetical protein
MANSRPLIAIILLTFLGCTEVTRIRPSALLDPHPPSSVQVWLADASNVSLSDPRLLTDDRLTGRVKGRQIEIPLSQVAGIEVRHAAPLRAVVLIQGGMAAVVLAVIVVEDVTKPAPRIVTPLGGS